MPFVNPVYEDIFAKNALHQPISFDEQIIISKFLKRFVIKGWDQCWEWVGAIENNGYGIITILGKLGRKQKRAHRLSYCYFTGPIPSQYEVCHSCDNPSCVNPKHLFVGTQADNMKDRHSKKRYNTQPKGAKHGLASLTEGQVKKIRALYFNGELNQFQLADKYKVDQTQISYVINNQTYTKTKPDGSKDESVILSRRGREVYKERKRKVRALLYMDYQQGMSYKEMIEKYHISKGTVWKWIATERGSTRKYTRKKKP